MPKAITISPGDDYYPLTIKDAAAPLAEPGKVRVKITAASLNHRDLYIRQGLYPSISFDAPILADGCGTRISSAVASEEIVPSQRVVINPGTGWISDPTGPEGFYTVIGGTSTSPLGTLQEIISVPAADVELAPEHLSDAEAAALPLTGLTAWRALFTKSGNAVEGRNILVTGIGGGVALMTLLFAVALGCNVFVTSSSEEKIARAEALGAKGGVNYRREDGWGKKLQKLLPKERPFLDTVIDGAGGDVVGATWRLLKNGGVVVSYGMTTLEQPTLPVQAVMKNIELKGSTMGSRREFGEMVRFVREKRIRPVIERVVADIENLAGIDGLFEDMKKGTHFGKLVVQIAKDKRGSNKL